MHLQQRPRWTCCNLQKAITMILWDCNKQPQWFLQIASCDHDETIWFTHAITMTFCNLQERSQCTSANGHSNCNDTAKFTKATAMFYFGGSWNAIPLNHSWTAKVNEMIRKLKKSDHKALPCMVTVIVMQLVNLHKSKCETSCKLARARVIKFANSRKRSRQTTLWMWLRRSPQFAKSDCDAMPPLANAIVMNYRNTQQPSANCRKSNHYDTCESQRATAMLHLQWAMSPV